MRFDYVADVQRSGWYRSVVHSMVWTISIEIFEGVLENRRAVAPRGEMRRHGVGTESGVAPRRDGKAWCCSGVRP